MLAAHDAGRSRKKMKTVIIMQARSSSSRLPGKAMLPVGGYPSAALAALRAGNLGLETLVATSAEPSDDGLADVLTDVLGKHGIRVVRGPLEDVLARYALAVNELPEDSVVVRLTGDNVLPDGDLVRELVSGISVARLAAERPSVRIGWRGFYGFYAAAGASYGYEFARSRACDPMDPAELQNEYARAADFARSRLRPLALYYR
jgi:hypothetical protein